MNIQQRSRKEYIHRINRVVDYIEAHLDEEQSLEKLGKPVRFIFFELC